MSFVEAIIISTKNDFSGKRKVQKAKIEILCFNKASLHTLDVQQIHSHQKNSNTENYNLAGFFFN